MTPAPTIDPKRRRPIWVSADGGRGVHRLGGIHAPTRGIHLRGRVCLRVRTGHQMMDTHTGTQGHTPDRRYDLPVPRASCRATRFANRDLKTARVP